MNSKYIKIIFFLIISISIIVIISIFIYLEISSKRFSINFLPNGYEKNINEDIFNNLNIINEKKNDSLYVFYTVKGNTSNSNLFFTKYYKTDKFSFKISEGSRFDFSEVKRFDSDFFKGSLPPSGIFNENYTPVLQRMNIYVQNYTQISSTLYECDSKYFFMILNNKYTTLGIYKNMKIYIQLIEKENYVLLSVFSSDSHEELDLFKNLIKQ